MDGSLYCERCRKQIASAKSMKRHLKSNLHIKNLDDEYMNRKQCLTCDESFSSVKAKQAHMNSSRHRNKLLFGDGKCCGRQFYCYYDMRLHQERDIHKRRQEQVKEQRNNPDPKINFELKLAARQCIPCRKTFACKYHKDKHKESSFHNNSELAHHFLTGGDGDRRRG